MMPFKCPHQQNFMFWSDMKHEIGRQPNQIWSKPTFFPRNDVWEMILMIPIRSLVPDVGIGTSLVWIFWKTLYLRCPKPSMGVSVRLFGISDLPYSMAGIRIFAEEERNNRIVIMNGMWDLERLNVAGFGILPYQVAISTTPRPFFSL